MTPRDCAKSRTPATGQGGIEDRLTVELARFLFDQGLNPLTKPLIGGLEPDLLDSSVPSAFYVEAKQYVGSAPLHHPQSLRPDPRHRGAPANRRLPGSRGVLRRLQARRTALRAAGGGASRGLPRLLHADRHRPAKRVRRPSETQTYPLSHPVFDGDADLAPVSRSRVSGILRRSARRKQCPAGIQWRSAGRS
jgi:hypothetical protein